MADSRGKTCRLCGRGLARQTREGGRRGDLGIRWAGRRPNSFGGRLDTNRQEATGNTPSSPPARRGSTAPSHRGVGSRVREDPSNETSLASQSGSVPGCPDTGTPGGVLAARPWGRGAGANHSTLSSGPPAAEQSTTRGRASGVAEGGRAGAGNSAGTRRVGSHAGGDPRSASGHPRERLRGRYRGLAHRAVQPPQPRLDLRRSQRDPPFGPVLAGHHPKRHLPLRAVHDGSGPVSAGRAVYLATTADADHDGTPRPRAGDGPSASERLLRAGSE